MAIRAQHREAPFALIQSFFSGTPGLIAVAAARLLGIPSAVHVAGGELIALRDIGYGGRLSRRGRVREALVLRAASMVTAPSEPMVTALAALGIKAQRVPLGVDRQAWPCRLPAPRQPGACARLLHVGSLNRVKDQPPCCAPSRCSLDRASTLVWTSWAKTPWRVKFRPRPPPCRSRIGSHFTASSHRPACVP